jgi:hypothetical protein
MTRDDIIRMAGEAGIRIAGPMDTIDPRNLYAHELERFAVACMEKVPRREWVGLTEQDFSAINQSSLTKLQAATCAESILKEKNGQ